MNILKNNKGFSLVELLASITILSIFLLLFGNTLSSNYKYSSSFDKKLTSVYVAEQVLEYYQGYPSLENKVTTGRFNPSTVAGLNELHAAFPTLTDKSSLNDYEVFVTVTKPTGDLKEVILNIKVEVRNLKTNINKLTILEGSARK